jgi:AraC-like DNA-binding protein
VPFLSLPETSAQLGDPVQVAERLATLIPVRSCDAVERPSPARPFRCHTGGLRLGPLSLVAIWGPGLRGEVDGTAQASFILLYRGQGHFRIGRRSLRNLAGRTPLYLPPEPWRTSNDAIGGITIRLDPDLIRRVGLTMAGPEASPEPWQALATHPLVVELGQPSNPVRFERLYRLMLFIQGLLLRQIVEVLAPALLVERIAPDPEVSGCAIDALVDWIHAHCHEAISLSELEQRSHYSRRSLQYAFKARFGCGPMQYLRRQRLWLARRQLEDPRPGSSVGSIASACGYLSLASFSRDFQRCFGIAPSSLLAQRRWSRKGQ